MRFGDQPPYEIQPVTFASPISQGFVLGSASYIRTTVVGEAL